MQGPDGLPAEFYTELIETLLEPIKIICNEDKKQGFMAGSDNYSNTERRIRFNGDK